MYSAGINHDTLVFMNNNKYGKVCELPCRSEDENLANEFVQQ